MDFTRVDSINLADCVRLFITVFNTPPWNENWGMETATQRLQDCYNTPGFYGLLVRDNEEPLGFKQSLGFAIGFTEQWDQGKGFYLKEMCITPERQQCGIGTALMQRLQEDLKRQGIGKLYLHTAQGTVAQSFYEKQGFYPSEKMIMMTKRLGIR